MTVGQLFAKRLVEASIDGSGSTKHLLGVVSTSEKTYIMRLFLDVSNVLAILAIHIMNHGLKYIKIHIFHI